MRAAACVVTEAGRTIMALSVMRYPELLALLITLSACTPCEDAGGGALLRTQCGNNVA